MIHQISREIQKSSTKYLPAFFTNPVGPGLLRRNWVYSGYSKRCGIDTWEFLGSQGLVRNTEASFRYPVATWPSSLRRMI